MARSLPPKPDRKSTAPDLPEDLASALSRVRKDPSDDEGWGVVEDACREHDRPEEAAALFGQILDNKKIAKALRVEVGRRAADFYEEWFEDTEYVLEILRTVLSIDRGARWAFERLSLLLTVAGRWEDLLGAYDLALNGCEDASERVALLEEVARVARDFAGESLRANDYLKELLLLRPNDDQLAANLERRLEQQGRHQDLIDVWTARLNVLPAGAALALRAQIAQRYLEELKDGESALSAIETLINQGGAEEQALSLLERLATTESSKVATRRKALGILEGRYTSAGRSSDVVRTLEQALALADDDAARISLHRQACELLASVDRAAEALDHAGNILRIDPSAEEVQARARDLARASGELGRYSAWLVRAADSCQNGARRARLVLEAARIEHEVVEDHTASIALYARALEDEGADAQAQLVAAQKLAVLLVDEAQKPQRLDVLEKLASLEDEASEARSILGEAAALAGELGDADRALRLWQLRLSNDDADVEALSARIAILERTERWDALITDLQRRALCARDSAEQRADLVSVAKLHEERRDDLASAIEAWALVESRFGRSTETLDALVELAGRAERHEDVVELLTAALETERDAGRRVAQHGLLGDTLRLRLGKAKAAIVQYELALDLAPTDSLSRAGLRALVEAGDQAASAVESLARALTASSEWPALLELLETRIALAKQAEKRRDVLLEAGHVYESKLGDYGSALGVVRRAFALDPSPNIELELIRLARHAGDFRGAVEGYRLAGEGLEDPGRLEELLMAQGSLEERELAALDDALSSFRRVIELSPKHAQAARSVLRVACASGRHEDLAWGFVEHCRALDEVPAELTAHIESLVVEKGNSWDAVADAFADRIASHDGLSERVAHDLKRLLAIWHRDRRNDADSAEFVLRRAAKDYPDVDTLRMLAELQRRAPGRPLVQTLVAIADNADNDLSALREAADIALNVVQDAALAKPILARSLEHASNRFREEAESGDLEVARAGLAAAVSAWSLGQLVREAIEHGERKQALELLVMGSKLPVSREDSIALRFRAAEIAAAEPADGKAVELCRAILESEPAHAGAIALLSSLYEGSGQLDELLELRKRELELNPPLERRLSLRLDIAAVTGDLGLSADGRIAALRQNLDEQPGHAESVQALAQVLSGLERFAELAAFLGEQAEAVARVGESSRAASLWARAGHTFEERLSDVERALSAFRSSVKLEATTSVLDRLAAICSAREEHAAASSWLEQRLALTPSDDFAARRKTLGALASALVSADEEPRARRFLEQGLLEDPAADEARRKLALLYREAEDWSLLAPLQEGGVEHAPSDEARVEYLRSAALVQWRRLGNLEAAIPLLDRAVGLAPADQALRLVLADGLRKAARYDESRALLTALLEEFGRRRTKERAQVHHHLAKIAQATGDLDQALEQAEEASKIERTDPAILMLLAQVARQRGQLDRAEQAYRTLLLIVSRRVPQPQTQSSEEESDAVGESTILFELYGIARDKSDADRARDLLDSALEVATREPREAALLEEALRSAGQSDLLLTALDQRLAATSERGAAAQILVTKAQILAKGGRLEEAFEARLTALEKTPGDGRLVDSTKKVADELGQGERLVAHLARLAEELDASDAKAASELWLRLGGYAEDGGDVARAADLYERAQRTGHKPLSTFAALSRVLQALGDAQRTRGALERFVSAEGAQSNPEAFMQALVELGRIELGEGALENAVTHFDLALSRGASDEQIFTLLAPVARGGSLTPELVRLFARVAHAGDAEAELWALALAAELDDASVALLERAVGLARSQGDDARLVPLLERLIEVARSSDVLGSVRWALVELSDNQRSAGLYARAGGLLREAIDYAEAAEALALDGEAYALELHFGDLALNGLANMALAARSYEKLLAVAPSDARVWRPLLATYRLAGRSEELTALIDRVRAHVTEPEELSMLRMESVRLLVAAGELTAAEQQLRDAIEEQPENEEAQNLLSELFEQTGRKAELQKLLESLYDRARERGNAAEVARCALRLARLVEQEDRLEAISVLTASLSHTSQNREVLATLLGLYTPEDDASDRADVMESLIAVEQGEAAALLCGTLVDLRAQLGDDYGVGRALEAGFKACPENAEIGERLRSWLRSHQEYSRLAEVLVFDADHTPDVAAALAKLDEAARIYTDELGDPLAAADTLSRALVKLPGDTELLARLVESLVAVGETERALREVDTAIDNAPETLRRDLFRLRGALRVREFPQDTSALEAAVTDYEQAVILAGEGGLELRGELALVLEHLRGLYHEASDEAGERGVVLRQADLIPSLGDSVQVLDTLASWLRDHPQDTDVARRLGELATLVEDHGTAAFAYARLLDASEGAARREAVLNFADAAEKAGTAMVARSALEAMQREHPEDETLRRRLRHMYEVAGAYAELAAILFDQAQHAAEPSDQFNLLCEAGELFLKAQVGSAACEIFERALGLKPDAYGVASLLADAYLAQDNVDAASKVLQQAVDAHGKRRTLELSQLQHGLARVARAKGDEAAVLSWLETSLLTDRQNGHAAADLAVFAQERGMHDTAIKALQLITLLKTPGPMGRAEAYLRQAIIANQQGDAKKAVLLARKATATDPDYAEAQGFLAELGG